MIRPLQAVNAVHAVMSAIVAGTPVRADPGATIAPARR
jgi:hypothetical protein